MSDLPSLPSFEAIGDNIWCIDAFYVRPQNACVYLIGDGGEYALIETGSFKSVDNMLATLEALNIERKQVKYVVPTHIHLDHAGAAGKYMQALTEATLLVHPRGVRHMIDPSRLISSSIDVYGEDQFRGLYGDITAIPEERIRALEDGDSFMLGNRRLEVKHTRGHANHHFCIWDEQSRGWFTGDMFGVCYGPLRLASGAFVLATTTPTQFDPDAYKASVCALVEREPARMYLTHYGALDFEQRQADLLLDQIDAYQVFAQEQGADSDALNTAIMDDLEQRITRIEDAETAKRLRETIGPDARLNADGVAFWFASLS